MHTNPVVVRRTMGLLREVGIVHSAKGHTGGWTIAADLKSVTLRQLHEALGEPAVFAIGNRNETPECWSSNRSIPSSMMLLPKPRPCCSSALKTSHLPI